MELTKISDTEYTIDCEYCHKVLVWDYGRGKKTIELNAYNVHEMGNDEIDMSLERFEYSSTDYIISKQIKKVDHLVYLVYTDMDSITDEMMYQIDIRIAMEGF